MGVLGSGKGLIQILCPKARYRAVTDIDLNSLRDRGIKALILDLDNTLVPWRSSEISAEVRAWIRRAHELGIQTAVASNTHRWKRLEAICGELEIKNALRALKPRRGALRKAMDAMDSQPENTAIIGDQIITDILAGNRLGLFTILVNPISNYEFLGTKINRYLEKKVLNRLDQMGILPPVEKSAES